MTPDQVNKAQEQASAWRPQRATTVTAARPNPKTATRPRTQTRTQTRKAKPVTQKRKKRATDHASANESAKHCVSNRWMTDCPVSPSDDEAGCPGMQFTNKCSFHVTIFYCQTEKRFKPPYNRLCGTIKDYYTNRLLLYPGNRRGDTRVVGMWSHYKEKLLSGDKLHWAICPGGYLLDRKKDSWVVRRSGDPSVPVGSVFSANARGEYKCK